MAVPPTSDTHPHAVEGEMFLPFPRDSLKLWRDRRMKETEPFRLLNLDFSSAHLTYFPYRSEKKQSFTMFQEVLLSYLIKFKARAT